MKDVKDGGGVKRVGKPVRLEAGGQANLALTSYVNTLLYCLHAPRCRSSENPGSCAPATREGNANEERSEGWAADM